MIDKQALIKYFRGFTERRNNPQQVQGEGLMGGMAMAPRSGQQQPMPLARPPDQGQAIEAPVDHHLDRMWSVLTPQEKQGLFGGMIGGKTTIPAQQNQQGKVTAPAQGGIERSGYLPSRYQQRFNVVQPATTEPLIPRIKNATVQQ